MVVSTLYYLLKEALEDLGRLPRKLHLNLGRTEMFSEYKKGP